MSPPRRLIAAAPPAWCSADVVPPSLADAIAAIAMDEAASTRLPGIRAAARPVLLRLRQAAAEALAAAEHVAAALSAAEAVAAGVSQLAAAPQLHAARWMDTLAAALPGLGFGAAGPGGDARLVAAALQGLALVAAARPADAPMLAAVAAAARNLLAHPVADVADLVYAMLPEMFAPGPAAGAAASAERAAAALQLLTLPPVLEQLVVQGLADARRRQAVAVTLLAAMGACGGAAVAPLLAWQAWVDCYSFDPAVAPLVEALGAAWQQVSVLQCSARGGLTAAVPSEQLEGLAARLWA
jgi:hypothetical protein